MSVVSLLRDAARWEREGRLAEAVRGYRDAVGLDGTRCEAWAGLGRVLLTAGRPAESAQAYRRALHLNSVDADLHYGLGCALQALGDPGGAEAAYRGALAADASHVHALNNLGSVLHLAGRAEEAGTLYRQALSLDPAFADARYNLGCLLRDRGRPEEAREEFQCVADADPGHWRAPLALGDLERSLDRPGAAFEWYRKAWGRRPQCAEARFGAALALEAQGDRTGAAEQYRAAISLRPDFADAHFNLGCLCLQAGEAAAAADAFRRVLALAPDHAGARLNLGNALIAAGEIEAGIDQYQETLTRAPAFHAARGALGCALLEDGRVRDAVECFRGYLEQEPENVQARSNFLFALNYLPELDPVAVRDAHFAFGDRYARPPAADARDGERPVRRLRVGYVSPDFRRHAVAFFVEPVLARHDRDRVEVFAYYNHPIEDETTRRLRGLADCWRPVSGMTDAQFVEQVRADRIDILVDLAGHTAANRLAAFVQRPAPVQATWLGYLNTTGLVQMDYRIADEHTAPSGWSEGLHRERVMRLPGSQWCYASPEDCPGSGPSSSARDGAVTFGVFHNPAKVNETVLDWWARILAAVPGSRLLFAGAYTPRHRRAIAEFLRGRGVLPGRLEYLGKLDFGAYLHAHRAVDVQLDTFPYAGGTTTCHSLWMGVPVVTYAGPTLTSRGGASLLRAVGLGELVADSPEAYVRNAADLARDLERRMRLRRELRDRVAASPLTDARAFVRHLEQLYLEMWTGGRIGSADAQGVDRR